MKYSINGQYPSALPGATFESDAFIGPTAHGDLAPWAFGSPSKGRLGVEVQTAAFHMAGLRTQPGLQSRYPHTDPGHKTSRGASRRNLGMRATQTTHRQGSNGCPWDTEPWLMMLPSMVIGYTQRDFSLHPDCHTEGLGA